MHRVPHPKGVDLVFEGPLSLLQSHMEPYALTNSYTEMEKSNYYDLELVPLPRGSTYWVSPTFFTSEQINKTALLITGVQTADELVSSHPPLHDSAHLGPDQLPNNHGDSVRLA